MSSAVSVLGNGPIGFTDSNGNQKFIPLSALEFLDGNINVKNWPPYDANENIKNIVDALLDELVDNAFLRPGSSPPPKPAMVLEAAVPGAFGNKIQVEFSLSDTSEPTLNATIMAQDSYEGLSYDSTPPTSPAFIKNVLGTGTLTGTRPTLIRVKDTETPSQPKEGSYLLTGGDSSTKSFTGIDGDPTGTAFTAEAWKEGSEGNNITVTISDLDADEETFTLEVKFERSLTDIKLSDLPDELADDGIVLTVTAPDEGFALPALGTIGLSGGSDPKAASPASATIVAQS